MRTMKQENVGRGQQRFKKAAANPRNTPRIKSLMNKADRIAQDKKKTLYDEERRKERKAKMSDAKKQGR